MNLYRHKPLTRALLLGVLVLIVSSLILVATSNAANKPAKALSELSDEALQRLSISLEEKASGLGLALLEHDAEQTGLLEQRELASAELAQWLRNAYKAGSEQRSVMIQVFGSGSIRNASDRLQMVRTVNEQRARIIRSIDAADAAFQMGGFDKSQTVAKLTNTQNQLHQVQAEKARRQAIVAENKAKREAAAAKKAAEKQVQAPGQLVAFAGSGVMAGQISPQVLDAYLASKSSPMMGQGMAFVQSGMRWGLDPRLLVAIAGAESNFGSITCGPHNAWGWACPNSPAEFTTWAHGIDTVASGLRRYYLDEGRTSVALIQQKYAPSGAANDPTGLNNHWVNNVSKFLGELGGNPGNVGSAASPTAQMPDIGGLGLVGAATR